MNKLRDKRQNMWSAAMIPLCVSLLIISAGMGVATGAQLIPLKIGGGAVGGTFFPMMTSTMVVLNDNIPGLVSTVIPGSSTTNIRKFEAGGLDIGLSYLNWAYEAYNGIGLYSDKKYKNILTITSLPTHPFNYVVASNSEIKSLKDLIGKRINVDRKGSGTELTIKRLLELDGITYDDITKAGGKITTVEFGQAVTLMRDRALDLAIFDNSPPDANIMQVETVFPARVLNLGKDLVNRYIQKYPGYVVKVVPAGAYKGQKEDAVTVGWGPILLARTDLDQELVYKITKAMFENIDKLAEGFKGLKDLSLATATEGVAIPFHPGAERYLKEKGVLK